MILVYETAVGYGIFLKNNEAFGLLDTYMFASTEEAVQAYLETNKLSKPIALFFEKSLCNVKDSICVSSPKLADIISSYTSTAVLADPVMFRDISNVHTYFNMTEEVYKGKMLRLAHKISGEKMKMNPDKLDAMVIQSISLIEDFSKDINLHCMRLREWYGYYFPELSSLLMNNNDFIQAVIVLGKKEDVDEKSKNDLEGLFGESLTAKIFKLAETSMGAEAKLEDMNKIVESAKGIQRNICFKGDLSKYLNEKMHLIAPNLCVLVGPLLGAKIISSARSLEGLAKLPASTVQLLGSERSLFQALRNKSNTPKYGMIFESPLVSKVSVENKGKIARTLAAKIVLAARIDCLEDANAAKFGLKAKKAIENRIEVLENKIKAGKKVQNKRKHILKPMPIHDDCKDFKKLKK